MRIFKDREEAANRLAAALRDYAGKPVVVYALPRGGVGMGLIVAKALKVPLDLVIARKVGAPDNEEFAVAAIAEDGDLTLSEFAPKLDPVWFKQACAEEQAEAKRRREAYLGARPAPEVKGKIAIIVDDGIATGLTMKAIIKELRHREPARVVIAVPVAPPETLAELRPLVDDIVVLVPDLPGGAVGGAYQDFPQVSDDEVVQFMKNAPL